MKIRTDFVTNSSSSSFIIEKKKLTDNQLFAIRENSGFGSCLGIANAEEGWFIDENDLFIRGSTYMDNYNINMLFVYLGIDKDIAWTDLCVGMPETQEAFDSLYDKSCTQRESIDDTIDRYRRWSELRKKHNTTKHNLDDILDLLDCIREEEI